MTKIDPKTLMEAGVHYGYSRTRRHPTVTPFLYGNKNGIDIIDIEKTVSQIEKAGEFLSSLINNGKSVIFVGVKPESQESIVDIAQSLKQSYITERWIGGMITNFNQMRYRIQKLIKMREEKTDLSKYTKKEQILLARELNRLERYFSGVSELNKLPDALVIVDPKKESIAVLEARKAGIPIVAIGNTDCSTRDIDYPIVANDGSRSSLKAIFDILKSAVEKK